MGGWREVGVKQGISHLASQKGEVADTRRLREDPEERAEQNRTASPRDSESGGCGTGGENGTSALVLWLEP